VTFAGIGEAAKKVKRSGGRDVLSGIEIGDGRDDLFCDSARGNARESGR
jgi:hypothetical protein